MILLVYASEMTQFFFRRVIQISVLCFITNITFITRSDYFMEAYKICDEMEKLINTIGIKTDYRICRMVTLFLVIETFFCIIYTFVACLVSEDSFGIIASRQLLIAMPLILLSVPIYNYLMFASLLYSRFSVLNKFIYDQLYVGSDKINVELSSLARIHYNLCKSCNLLIHSNEYAFALYYLYTFLQLGSTLLSIMDYFPEELDAIDILWNVWVMTSNAATIISLALLKSESLATGTVLCQLSDAYFDDKMNDQV